jgi:hypothetical protein
VDQEHNGIIRPDRARGCGRGRTPRSRSGRGSRCRGR